MKYFAKNLELTQRYMHGSMSAVEKANFEQLRKDDPEFDNEILLQMALIHKLSRDYLIDHVSQHAPAWKAAYRKRRQRKRIIASVAASILLAVGIFIIKQLPKRLDLYGLYVEYYSLLDFSAESYGIPTDTKITPTPDYRWIWSKPEDSSKTDQIAAKYFPEAAEDSINPNQMILYLGANFLNFHQPYAAIRILKKVEATDSVLYAEAVWLRGMAQLRLKNLGEARKAFCPPLPDQLTKPAQKEAALAICETLGLPATVSEKEEESQQKPQLSNP